MTGTGEIKWDEWSQNYNGSHVMLSTYEGHKLCIWQIYNYEENGEEEYQEAEGLVDLDQLIEDFCKTADKEDLEDWAAYFRQLADKLDAAEGWQYR